MSAVTTTDGATLGAILERDRLRRRERRLQLVVRELRWSARAHAARAGAPPVPRGLAQAIDGFEDELGRVRRRLHRAS